MPTYEYKCFDCEAQFEVSQRITEEPLSVCTSCGGSNIKRLLFAAPFQLKGTGWYKTDYASSSSSSSNSNKNHLHASSTKPEVEKSSDTKPAAPASANSDCAESKTTKSTATTAAS